MLKIKYLLNGMEDTCKQKRVKISPTHNRAHCDHLHAEEGEDHVQVNPERQGDHMHASEGEYQAQLNAGSHGGHLHADGRAKGKARAPHSIKSLSSTDSLVGFNEV